MTNSMTYLGKTYNDNEILSGSFSRKQSLSMSELSVDTMEVTVRPYLHLDFFVTRYHNNDPDATVPNDEPDAPFQMFTRDRLRFETSETNPLAGQFQQNTPLVQYVGGSQIAVWFLQSVERLGTNIYKLSGFSSLGKLTQVTHYGGIYGIDAQHPDTVTKVVSDILGAKTVTAAPRTEAIPKLTYFVYNDVLCCATTNIAVNATIADGTNCISVISVEFRNIALYGWLPIATARDNLQQVLFAINASLQTDEQGILHIQNLSTATQSIISQNVIFQSGASVKYNTPVTKVVLVEHQYISGSERKTLFDNTNGALATNFFINFDSPIDVSTFQTTGSISISQNERGTNYAVVSGIGTLTGIPYAHIMREINKNVASANVENIVRVENATLVGLTASDAVSDRLAAYYACRNAINVAVAQAFIGCGSVVDAFDPYDEIMRSACIESEQISLSNIPKSTISALVGFTPWQTELFDDEREVLTGSGTWEVPYGVTKITAVLIGGGSGGKKGENGNKGTAYSAYGSVPPLGVVTSAQAGEGGDGGKGGAGGAPGKILRIDISVVAGQTFSFACGAKGTGGASPTAGTNTTFGSYSSATGAISEAGYADPVTGKRYAIAGSNGVKGGKGGDGGSVNATSADDGENGGNVGQYTGGAGTHGVHYGTEWIEVNWVCSKGGVGGGGASNKANGSVGTAPTNIYGEDGVGGRGANGNTSTWDDDDYGCGGNGGDGGGGGGGAGAYYYIQRAYPSGEPSISFSYSPKGGSGGTGGIGGDGVNGCVILYYRQPAEH